MLCRHCVRRKANRARGLCRICFCVPGVRQLYPCRKPPNLEAVKDHNGGATLPDSPTDAPPGSEAKVQVLIQRAKLGVSLWHPDDAPLTLP